MPKSLLEKAREPRPLRGRPVESNPEQDELALAIANREIGYSAAGRALGYAGNCTNNVIGWAFARIALMIRDGRLVQSKKGTAK